MFWQNDRMTDMAIELKEHNIAAVSLWPGAVKTEAMQDIMEGKYGERLASMVCVIFVSELKHVYKNCNDYYNN